jgi:hypothetical protein
MSLPQTGITTSHLGRICDLWRQSGHQRACLQLESSEGHEDHVFRINMPDLTHKNAADIIGIVLNGSVPRGPIPMLHFKPTKRDHQHSYIYVQLPL